MSRQLKFRQWDGKQFHYWGIGIRDHGYLASFTGPISGGGLRADNSDHGQFTGLQDKNGKDIYLNDIMQFDNGDKFEVDFEDWLGFFARWIGDPKCEDQTRDPYRISRAEIIGNRYENKDLI